MNDKQIANFLAKIENCPHKGCWLWTGSLTPQGYGQFRLGKEMKGAHVVSFEHFNGPLNGLDCLHKCNVKRCVNPQHLKAGTQSENQIDVSIAGQLKVRKLSDEQVREIKIRLEDKESIRSIARVFDVAKGTIDQIKQGQSYKRITV